MDNPSLNISDIVSENISSRTRFAQIRPKLITCLDLSRSDPCQAVREVDIHLYNKWSKFIEECDKNTDPFNYHPCHILLIVGLIYLECFVYKESINMLQKAEEVSRHFYSEQDMRGNKAEFLKRLYVALARVLSQVPKSNLKETFSYIERARNLIKTFPAKNREKTAFTLLDLPTQDLEDVFYLYLAEGDVYMREKDQIQAKKCYIQALEHIEEAGDPSLLLLVDIRLILLCVKLESIDCLKYFEEARKHWNTVKSEELNNHQESSYLDGIYYFGEAMVLYHQKEYYSFKLKCKDSLNTFKAKLPPKNWIQEYYTEECKTLVREAENVEDAKASESLYGIGVSLDKIKLEVEESEAYNLQEDLPPTTE